MDVHCLINQQVVCSKYLNLSCVEPVVSTLRFIPFFGNNYYHFHGFLSEIKAKHSCCTIQPFTGFAVVTFYCNVLNKGPIEIWLNKKPHPQPLLWSIEKAWKLAFPVDLICFKKKFKIKLQGKTTLICKTMLWWSHFDNCHCLNHK